MGVGGAIASSLVLFFCACCPNMSHFCCLPAEAIVQAPHLVCSHQRHFPSPSSTQHLRLCTWPLTPRIAAGSRCLAHPICARIWSPVCAQPCKCEPFASRKRRSRSRWSRIFLSGDGSQELVLGSDNSTSEGSGADEERDGGFQPVAELESAGSFGEEQEDDELSPGRLQELLFVAREELENARANSAKLEERAQKIAEEAFLLRDEAAEAGNAAAGAKANVESIVKEEGRAEEGVENARNAFNSAGVKVMLAEDALAEVLEKLNSEQSDKTIRGIRSRSADFGGVAEHERHESELTAAAEDSFGEFSVDVEKSAELTESSGLVSDSGMWAENGEMVGTDAQNSYQLLAVDKEAALSRACLELRQAEAALAKREEELSRIRCIKAELVKLAAQLMDAAEKSSMRAAAADEDAAIAMSLAEQAVALEVDAAQRLGDAEIAFHKAETAAADAAHYVVAPDAPDMAEKLIVQTALETSPDLEPDVPQISADKWQVEDEGSDSSLPQVSGIDGVSGRLEINLKAGATDSPAGNGNLISSLSPGTADYAAETERKTTKDAEVDSPREEDVDRPKVSGQLKKVELVKETNTPGISKTTNRSSRFFSASYFSLTDDGAEFSLSTLFTGLAAAFKEHFPKAIVGVAFLLAGGAMLNSRLERRVSLVPSDVTTSVDEVKTTAKPLFLELTRIPKQMKKMIDKLPKQEINEEETSLFDVLWLLLASVIFVPIFQKMPGGSPVLGYLAAGVLIGPYTLSIIQNVHGTKAIAEFGVVFLLFNIGLELSVERLSSMKKYVFGFGSIQVLCTALFIGLFVHLLSGIAGPASIVIGNGLALSSTAVVLQVLQERGESTSRHGRATFSVLLFQDLAVVVLLILIPLLSPNSSKGGIGFQAIAEALGIAAIKAVIAISGIIAGGRLFLRPIYKRMAENHNPEIFAANTLLVVLGTSLLTARAGLSMALGAFLAGLLLAETEYALQVESDIAPYRGLLLGLFFMTVGMSIDPKLFVAKLPIIFGSLALLLCGKTLLVASVGRLFGLSSIAAVRAGLLLAPGGEFAFVAFGEAVNQGIMSSQLSSLLFLVVGLSMALTPWLAAGGQLVASRFDQQDVRSLLPAENETDDLQDHIIICGYGRVGQIIGQLLAERLIPFVALDIRSERVNVGRALDQAVFFGDAGSREVLHKVGAERAAAAVITLDTPGANYRTVWAISKHFPHLKTFVRAHDVDHGIGLEKAGATAVVPETLEPSLQLAAAVLAQVKLPASEIAATIDEFRSRHLSELSELSEASGTSLGYGFSRVMAKAKPAPVDVTSKERSNNEEGSAERTDGGVAVVL